LAILGLCDEANLRFWSYIRGRKQSAKRLDLQHGVIEYRLADELPSDVIFTQNINISHDWVVIRDTGKRRIQIVVRGTSKTKRSASGMNTAHRRNLVVVKQTEGRQRTWGAALRGYRHSQPR